MTDVAAEPRNAGLFERAEAEQRAGALIEQARGGDGGALALLGSAGMGKSALLDAIAVQADAADFTVLRAGGDQLELELAFSLVRQLFGGAVPDPDADDAICGECHAASGGNPFADEA